MSRARLRIRLGPRLWSSGCRRTCGSLIFARFSVITARFRISTSPSIELSVRTAAPPISSTSIAKTPRRPSPTCTRATSTAPPSTSPSSCRDASSRPNHLWPDEAPISILAFRCPTHAAGVATAAILRLLVIVEPPLPAATVIGQTTPLRLPRAPAPVHLIGRLRSRLVLLAVAAGRAARLTLIRPAQGPSRLPRGGAEEEVADALRMMASVAAAVASTVTEVEAATDPPARCGTTTGSDTPGIQSRSDMSLVILGFIRAFWSFSLGWRRAVAYPYRPRVYIRVERDGGRHQTLSIRHIWCRMLFSGLDGAEGNQLSSQHQ